MSNDEGGPAFHEPFHCFDDRGLGFRIDGTGGLVENQDGGILQEGTGESDALAFAARQTHSALADLGLVAVEEADDELMGVRRLRRLDDLVVTGRGSRVGDILGDTCREQHGLLEDDGELVTQVGQLVIAQVNPVEENLAGRGVIEASQ